MRTAWEVWFEGHIQTEEITAVDLAVIKQALEQAHAKLIFWERMDMQAEKNLIAQLSNQRTQHHDRP